MIHEDLKIDESELKLSDWENGADTKEEEIDSNGLFSTPRVHPVSKADRIRERAFRSRIHNSNKVYLKPYLRG